MMRGDKRQHSAGLMKSRMAVEGKYCTHCILQGSAECGAVACCCCCCQRRCLATGDKKNFQWGGKRAAGALAICY
jgi:hypothetical protein